MVEILLSSLCMKKDFQKELDDKIIAIDLIKKEMNEAKTREEHRLPFLSKNPKHKISSTPKQILYLLLSPNERRFSTKTRKKLHHVVGEFGFEVLTFQEVSFSKAIPKLSTYRQLQS